MRTRFEQWRAERREQKFWALWARVMPEEAQLLLHLRAKGRSNLDPWSLILTPVFTGSEILDDYRRFPRLNEIAGCLKLSPEERIEAAQKVADTYGPVEDRIKGHQFLTNPLT